MGRLLDKPIQKTAAGKGTLFTNPWKRKAAVLRMKAAPKAMGSTALRLGTPAVMLSMYGRSQRTPEEQAKIDEAAGRDKDFTGKVIDTALPPLVDTLRGIKGVKEGLSTVLPESVKRKVGDVARTVGEYNPVKIEPSGETVGGNVELILGGKEPHVGAQAHYGDKKATVGKVDYPDDPLFGINMQKETAQMGATAGVSSAALMYLLGGKKAKKYIKDHPTLGREIPLTPRSAMSAVGKRVEGPLGSAPRAYAGRQRPMARAAKTAVAGAVPMGSAYVADKMMVGKADKSGRSAQTDAALAAQMDINDKLAAFEDAKLVRDEQAKSDKYNFNPVVAGLVGGTLGSSLGWLTADKNKLLWSTLGGLGGAALPYLLHAMNKRFAGKPDTAESDRMLLKSLKKRKAMADQNVKDLRKTSAFDWKKAGKAMWENAKDYKYEIGAGLAGAGSAYSAIKAMNSPENRLGWGLASLGLGGAAAALAYAKHKTPAPSLDLSKGKAGSYGDHPSLEKTMRNLDLLPIKPEFREQLSREQINKALWDIAKIKRDAAGDPERIRKGVGGMLGERFQGDFVNNPAFVGAISNPKFGPSDIPGLYTDVSGAIEENRREEQLSIQKMQAMQRKLNERRKQQGLPPAAPDVTTYE